MQVVRPKTRLLHHWESGSIIFSIGGCRGLIFMTLQVQEAENLSTILVDVKPVHDRADKWSWTLEA